ncbi:hypothetical protein ACQPZJ_21505 [Actinoplanes sp. CA-054009]
MSAPAEINADVGEEEPGAGEEDDAGSADEGGTGTSEIGPTDGT